MWWKLNNPTPEQVKQARENAGLTQSQAAAVIYKKLLAWQRYESGDREMDAAYWELFLIKTVQTDTERERNFRNAGAGLDIAI